MDRVNKILIMGIGGIGGLVSTALIRANYAVDLITNNEKITHKINTKGIQIVENNERVAINASAHTFLKDLQDDVKYDIVMLIMKATSVEEAVRKSLEHISSDGYWVTFQNGIVEDKIATIVGRENIVSAVVGFGGTMHRPGLYEKTSPGDIHIGELSGIITSRIETLRSILLNVSPVSITDNIYGVLWSKLAINCCINGFAVITGQTLGEMLTQKFVRRMFLKTYQEVVDVAHQQNIKLEKIAANPYLLYLPPNSGFLKRFVKDLIVRFVGRKYRDIKSSALQSIERGRKTENEYLNGFVAERGKEVGIATPMNDKISELISLIEKKELHVHPDNLDLLMEAISLS